MQRPAEKLQRGSALACAAITPHCGSPGLPPLAVPPARSAAPDAKLNEIKGLLGKMLFSGSSMEKKVRGWAGAR